MDRKRKLHDCLHLQPSLCAKALLERLSSSEELGLSKAARPSMRVQQGSAACCFPFLSIENKEKEKDQCVKKRTVQDQKEK